jgi:cytochrome c oxidase assembly protein subunit 15
MSATQQDLHGGACAQALSAGERRTAERLSVGFALLLAATVGLMTLGALVRAHEAGLACPDWPLCFGELVPRMDLRVAFEWSHRAVAGSVGLAFLAMTALALRRPGLRRALAVPLGATALVLGVQVLLGALTVWHLLASWTVTSHLLVGNAFAVALLLTAVRLRELARPAGRLAVRTDARTRALLRATLALLVFQVALGGLVSSSFAGLACPEWPTCNGGRWFPSWSGGVGLHLAHRTNAYLLLGLFLAAFLRARGTPGLGGLTAAAAALAVGQVLVGIANVLLSLPVEVTGLHSLLAALLVLTQTWAVRTAAWSAP